MQVSTLNDLFVRELRDVYNAERQLIRTLPTMAKKANSPDLSQAIEEHLGQTEQQAERLEQVFSMLDVSSRGPVCKGMKGIIEEGKETLEETDEPDVTDAGIIASAQKVEHYEIATYGTLCEYANVLGHSEIADLLKTTLEEEKAADKKLSELAERGINAMAINGGGSEEMENGRSKNRSRR
ncbi:MAG TPA: ferritin-like domain-containing protein [Gemmatimonadaceae bacterium]|jgi:ferritin-like metal-binding protein YciE|nr:ferritin-like domain-containing protein [Gemmatimonadaceae bacterium]